ncbi:MAG: SAM-dependent methyltransferase [Thiocapsa sp.]|uniref:Eco57I restriction-modification methylase domain-containing protein n=1 Tax=Thiocapsa sp. TaxID=2024551 RepID=UPI001BCCF576|nr:SAM-dependent methyltransferase [Thiocapsa sp.]QVL47240.1 MAG: SAM-dependent methyltransferase [Thiocapsa sp.]
MDKDTRSRIQRATQAARGLLEQDFEDQLAGVFDIRLDGTIAGEPGSHLDALQRIVRNKLVAAIEHFRASGQTTAEAVASYRREAAFTTLNRFVALKMLEARGLVQECISRGEQSSGFKEFCGLAPGLVQLPDRGYRLYIESLFDELSVQIRVLFNRRDAGSLLWPRRQTLLDLLEILNDPGLGGFSAKGSGIRVQGSVAASTEPRTLNPEPSTVWEQDETIGWIYQYYNDEAERKRMREESSAPRNSRELAVRNQSGRGVGGEGLQPLRELYATKDDYLREIPRLIVEHNLHGIDIDRRAVQIAGLSLWLRAQRAWYQGGVKPADRPRIRRSNLVCAEPMPGEKELLREFVEQQFPAGERSAFAFLLEKVFDRMTLAGEAGSLLRIEEEIGDAIAEARALAQRQAAPRQFRLSLGDEPPKQTELNLPGLNDEQFWQAAEQRIYDALKAYAEQAENGSGFRRRLFADDAAQGFAFIDLCRKSYDVTVMNPPFGAASTRSRDYIAKAYPRSKNDLLAACVERGVHWLCPGGLLGAITSRTAFFLTSYRQWRQGVVLGEAKPVVMADLGYGVMDAAMVEAAAYVLRKH